MDERALQGIKKHLQNDDTQERIQQNIQRGRSELTVTIGRAARLFQFSENQLRDWEERGLLKPLRSKHVTGQRQYPPAELDKLAIIRELIDDGYSPGEIPLDIDSLWYTLSQSKERRPHTGIAQSNNGLAPLPLDERIRSADKELFWRYFTSQALRLALSLLSEDVPGTVTALVLPFQRQESAVPIQHPDHLLEMGESLVGWVGQNRSFYTFLETTPSFEYPSDFRVQMLQADEEDEPQDSTLLVLPRQARVQTFGMASVETIRRLLRPLYEEAEHWRTYFGEGMRDWLYPSTDFANTVGASDNLLHGIADMLIRLGGQNADGQDRWRFCCVLLPQDPSLPLQQQNLIVQAQSTRSPYKPGITRVSPDERVLSFRAFQSGHILYRREISSKDVTMAARTLEGPIRSAIAIPVGGEHGAAIAVLYITSERIDAFSTDDQRLLRIISRIIEELLLVYRVRRQVIQKFGDIMKEPDTIDRAFSDFLAENSFVGDIEALLKTIQAHATEQYIQPDSTEMPLLTEDFPGGAISIIAVDIDNQNRIIRKYGERVLRNLNLAIGQRIQKRLVDCRLYHIYAGKYYALLKGIPLEQAREVAERLREVLTRPYHIDAGHISSEQSILSDTTLDLADVTVRLGVTLYPYTKLAELLQRSYEAATSPAAEVRGLIISDIDQALDLGQEEGGNIVISWDPQVEDRGPHVRKFVPWITPE